MHPGAIALAMPDRPNIRAPIQIPESSTTIPRPAHDHRPRPRRGNTSHSRRMRAHDMRQRDVQRRLPMRVQSLPRPLCVPQAHGMVPRARHERAGVCEHRTGTRRRLDDLHDLVVHYDPQVAPGVESWFPDDAFVRKARNACCTVGVGDHLLAYGIERKFSNWVPWAKIYPTDGQSKSQNSMREDRPLMGRLDCESK